MRKKTLLHGDASAAKDTYAFLYPLIVKHNLILANEASKIVDEHSQCTHFNFATHAHCRAWSNHLSPVY